jgi:putative DNA primase/helicase
MTAANGTTRERPNRKRVFERQRTKPTPLPVKPEGIPASIKERAQCVVWNYIWDADKEKWTKPPYQAKRPNAKASSTKPRTWAPFNEAMAAYRGGECDGVGYVLNGDEVGIDLDDVRDPANGTIEPWAIEIVKTIASYAEISPSGTGIKIIARGTLKAGRKFTQIDAEMYSRGRYFALTGHVIGEHSVIEERQAEIDALLKMLDERNDAAKEAKGKRASSWNSKASPGLSASLTDEELIAKASAAEGNAGKKF